MTGIIDLFNHLSYKSDKGWYSLETSIAKDSYHKIKSLPKTIVSNVLYSLYNIRQEGPVVKHLIVEAIFFESVSWDVQTGRDVVGYQLVAHYTCAAKSETGDVFYSNTKSLSSNQSSPYTYILNKELKSEKGMLNEDICKWAFNVHVTKPVILVD